MTSKEKTRSVNFREVFFALLLESVFHLVVPADGGVILANSDASMVATFFGGKGLSCVFGVTGNVFKEVFSLRHRYRITP